MNRGILQLGNPQLYKVSESVKETESKKIEKIISELHDTIIKYNSVNQQEYAIAAPQIGFFKRIIYMFIDLPVVFINPILEFPNDEKVETIDCCMSFPGLGVKVERYKRCIIKYKNENWEDCQMELDGELSRIIQHEYDHLDGILSTMRAKDNKSFYIGKEIPPVPKENLNSRKVLFQSPPMEGEPEVFLFTGDSITDSNRLWGEDPRGLGEGYVGKIADILEKKQAAKVINKGFNGFMVQDLKSKWLSFLEMKPDVVSILIGINDVGLRIGNQLSMERLGFKSDYEYLIQETLNRTQAKIILMTPFVFAQLNEYAGWRPLVEEHIQAIKELADKYQLPFIDLDSIFIKATQKYGYKSLTTNGTHLTPYGHSIIAEEWCKAYEKMK